MTRVTPAATSPARSSAHRSTLLRRPGFLIRRLHQVHCALFIEETRQFRITPVQYSLMTTLAERGELDQHSIALEIGLERSSVAEVLPRLQARGLIARRRSSRDRRVTLVTLTMKGKALTREMAPAVRRAHERTVAELGAAGRRRFLRDLVRLVEINNDLAAVPLRLR